MQRNSFISALLCWLLLTGSLGGMHQSQAAMATEHTQILNNIQLLNSYRNQVQELATSINQYQLMLRNAKQLPDTIRSRIVNDLKSLAKAVQVGHGIAYNSARMAADFSKAYKDFDFYANAREPGSSFSEQYGAWSRTTQDTIEGALSAAKLQTDLFDEETDTSLRLKHLMMNPTGTMQVLQASGQVASMQVGQMQKLRQLLASQMQILAVHVAGRADRQAREDAALDKANQTTAIEGGEEPIYIGDSVW